MKYLNVKGIVSLLLMICAVLSFYFGGIMTFTFMQAAGLAAALMVFVLTVTFVTEKTSEQELIEEQDERNQYLALKRAAKNFEAVKYTLFLTMICCVTGFGLTREYAFIFMLIGAAVPYGVLKITYIINYFRYY